MRNDDRSKYKYIDSAPEHTHIHTPGYSANKYHKVSTFERCIYPIDSVYEHSQNGFQLQSRQEWIN